MPVAQMPATLDILLESLNSEIVLVLDTLEIAEINPAPNQTSLRFMSPADFKNTAYADRLLVRDGRRLSIASEWVKWPRRRTVNRTVYEPGQPRITPDNNLNTWFPSPNIPKAGDLTLWHRYIDHVFAPDPTYRDWFLAWLAYPIQHPGAKLNTAAVFWSTETGTGKSTLAYIMKEIYGQHNCSLLREADFDSKFNGWAVGKQFVEVDEMPAGSLRARKRADLLKSLTTRSRIPVDLKFQNRYEIRDTINYFYTSNHIESLYLDPQDRRFFVHDLGRAKLPEEFFRAELGPWLKAGGFAAIHHYLKHEIDLARPIVGGNPYSLELRPFSPNADAPHSTARRQAIEGGFSDAEQWINELLENPIPALGDRAHLTIFTARELYDIFRNQCPDARMGHAAFGRELTKRNMRLNDGTQVRLRDEEMRDIKLRLYSIAETRPKTVSEIRETFYRERQIPETDLND